MSRTSHTATMRHKDLETIFSRAMENVRDRQRELEIDIMRHADFDRPDEERKCQDRLDGLLRLKERMHPVLEALRDSRFDEDCPKLVLLAEKGDAYYVTKHDRAEDEKSRG